MNQCKPRSVEAIAEAVALIDPEKNVELLAHDVTGDGLDETFCNFFLHQVTVLLGCPVPQMRANDQLDWLKGEGSATHGWRQVFPVGAAVAAANGCPVVVGWKNPAGHPGHVALLRAPPSGEAGLWISQSGRTNFNHAPLVKGFGNRSPLLFFAHS